MTVFASRRVAGWLAGAASLAGATGAAAQDEPIVIGGAMSLTGIQAAIDAPALRGAEVAVQALNDAGGLLGRPVELINLDGKSDPVTVGNVTLELIDGGADLIMAPCDFDFGSPASREAQAAGLVGISTCASSPLYSSTALGDKQFTLSMWNTTMGAAGAEFACTTKGWDTAWVVTDTFIDYTKSLSRYFIDVYQQLGCTVLFEDTYTQGDQDFSAQLARLQGAAEPPDVIYVSSYMPDLATIIRAIREVGITTPILGGDTYDDAAVGQALGEQYGNEIYFVTHTFMSPEAAPEMGRFLELYQQEFGEPPDTAFVATGWDTVMVLAQAVEAAGSTDGAAVAKAMEDMQFDLLTGKLDWSPAAEGHEPDKEAALVQLVNGQPTFLGWTRPQIVPPP